MRLLDTRYVRWLETTKNVPPYAILSHRWFEEASKEVSFQDLQRRQALANEGPNNVKHTFQQGADKAGFRKLERACNRALQDGLDYIWIDTCCIDKTSSAELSEAINSMYAWYRDSAVCYVYLHDVDDIDQDDLISALNRAEWFKRGWTLQELLAPSNVYFFDKNWLRIGSKAMWASKLHEITHIRKEILLGITQVCEPSIAEKMSWAVGRKTEKIEDRAYSLMGIFDIHMPIIYGEGDKAFKRLQLEIMKSSDDQTIFAWHDSLEYPNPSRTRGSLASGPDVFLWDYHYPPANIQHSLTVRRLLHSAGWRSLLPGRSRLSLEDGYSVQNDGIHITLPMKQDGDSWLAVLRCQTEDQEFPYGIYLKELKPGSDSFLRTASTKLKQLDRKDLEGLALKKIRMMIDHDVPTIPPREFFTLRSTDVDWSRCFYYICLNPGCHDGQGGGRKALRSDTQIELESDAHCSCVYFQTQHEVPAILLIGIEDHRPWIHLLTNPDLCRIIDPAPRRPNNGTNHAFYTPHITSEPLSHKNEADPISPLSPISPTAGPSNYRNPQRSMTSRPVPLRGTRSECHVCAFIRQGGINIRDIKDSRADLLTETASGNQIEVDVRKGRAEVEVEYVITITADS